MNVLQVVPRIAEESSGPSHSVPALCNALTARGARVTLHVLEPAPASRNGAFALQTHPARRVLSRLGISPALRQALRQAAGSADVMHNHSLWMMPNVYPAWAVRGTKCRLLTSPRGTLSLWALRRSRWAKRLMWLLCQGRAVKASACFHATSVCEFQDVRRVGLRAPVAIIPNGVDVPPFPRPALVSGQRRRLLFLGRIHPVKGIDTLLRAWRNVQGRYPGWDLHLVGPDNDGYRPKMQALAQTLGAERVSFLEPVCGEQKTAAFFQADLFVLPTHSENFGLAVAEALAHGVPAIVTKGAPWSGLATHSCGWWIDPGERTLTECLREALSVPAEELRARGANGRAWMDREFSWARVGQMMHETYRWLLGGGPAPDWVRRAG